MLVLLASVSTAVAAGTGAFVYVKGGVSLERLMLALLACAKCCCGWLVLVRVLLQRYEYLYSYRSSLRLATKANLHG